MNLIEVILKVLTSLVTVIILSVLLPKIYYLFSKIPYGKKINVDDLSEEDKSFLKENSLKYKKIENYCVGLLMLIGFIILVNYYKFDLILPNLFLAEDYTGAKIFIVGVVSISYCMYFLTRIVSILIFGMKKGILMTDYEYIRTTQNIRSSQIVFHPYKKIFGKKVFILLILTLVVLVL